MRGEEIERRSMEIIEAELEEKLAEEEAPIIKRVIHTTADFSFTKTLLFTPEVIPLMRKMMQNGARLFTDTHMALAGINKTAAKKLDMNLDCFIADSDVAREAGELGVTRASRAMEKALRLPGAKLFVCGNAPTFLMPLLAAGFSAVKEEIAVVAVPVGFVHVVEVKEEIWQSGLPSIVNRGRRGGSNVAAAIVNALMYGIPGVRP